MRDWTRSNEEALHIGYLRLYIIMYKQHATVTTTDTGVHATGMPEKDQQDAAQYAEHLGITFTHEPAV